VTPDDEGSHDPERPDVEGRSQASPSAAQLFTFLIADVRGYTQFTLNEGDEAAQALASRLKEEADRAVSLRGGRVLEARGDEILAVFTSARQALRAALDLQRALRDRPLWHRPPSPAVGIGIDAGEAVPLENGYRGAALNLASRLSALASPGQVLASGTVTVLARRLKGVDYVECPPANLKGFSQPVPLFEIVEAAPEPDAAAAGSATTAQTLPLAGFLGSLPAEPIAGRGEELALLRRAVDEVQAGSGQLILLAGEPGAGKTRLAQEVTAEVHGRGFLVAAGSCYENRESTAFYPFRDALSMLYDAAGAPAQNKAALHWPYLARLVPGVRLIKPLDLAAEEDQERLFWSIAGFVEHVTGSHPIALLLDDLHWADASSLDLLQHLARRTRSLPVLILGTYRDTEIHHSRPLEDALRELRRQALVTRVPVRRLDGAGTMAMLNALLPDVDATDALAQMVFERTEGNPFFIRQVLEVLSGEDRSLPDSGARALEVPESIRSVTSQRLRRLAPDTQELLHTASVLGQTFSFQDLLEVAMSDTGVASQDRLEALLEDAQSAGILVGTDTESFAFDHTLTRETLYRELTARRRRRLHLAAAEALERRPADMHDHPADVARHFLEADAADRAVTYLLMAADQSAAMSARREAEAGYRRAIQVAAETASLPQLAEGQEKLGQVLSHMGRYEAAADSFRAAADTYRGCGNDTEAMRAEVGLVLALLAGQKPERAHDRLQPVVQEAEKRGATLILACAHAAEARVLMALGRPAEQLEAAKQAQALAEAIGDRPTLASALIDHATALHDLSDDEQSLRLIEQAIRVAEECGDQLTLWRGLNNAAVICWDQLGMEQARRYHDRALEVAEQSASPAHIAFARAVRGMYAWLQGEWIEASHWFEHAATVAASLQASPAGAILSGPGLIKALKGREEEATRVLQDCITRAEQTGDRLLLAAARQALARQDLIQGRAAKALQGVEDMLASNQLHGDERYQTLLVAAEAALDLRKDADAQRYLDELAGLKCQQPWVQVTREVLQGSLASHMGAHDTARSILAKALDMARRIPFVLGQADALRAWGLVEDAAGDTSRACDLLRQAHEIYRELGARPLAEAVERELLARDPRHRRTLIRARTGSAAG